jgi:DNA-binding CsgD family transcriptional regulator
MKKKHKKDWSKDELIQLYTIEGKTLQQIGDLYGVTRERVKQVMERYSIPRRDRFSCQKDAPHRLPFKNLSDYLARGKDHRQTMRKFLPEILLCAECQSDKNIHIHHIIYPARGLKDIQLLCKSCHFIKHRNGISYIHQIDIYNSYVSGVTTMQLSEEYDCARVTIYKIIAKIKKKFAAKSCDIADFS